MVDSGSINANLISKGAVIIQNLIYRLPGSNIKQGFQRSGILIVCQEVSKLHDFFFLGCISLAEDNVSTTGMMCHWPYFRKMRIRRNMDIKGILELTFSDITIDSADFIRTTVTNCGSSLVEQTNHVVDTHSFGSARSNLMFINSVHHKLQTCYAFRTVDDDLCFILIKHPGTKN